ncbi:MAG TPA: hypothetical protein VHO23_01540 [Candidatus Paceibacterota bacterium]|nr:hypothetical protein [Candidatus Paceibacterota bacterium]
MNEEMAELKDLLEENLEVAKDNNRLLKLIRRDATLGLIAKVVLWLVLLGVPLLFLGSYLGPLLESMARTPGATPAGVGIFGLPSPEQAQELLEEYKSLYEVQ